MNVRGIGSFAPLRTGLSVRPRFVVHYFDRHIIKKKWRGFNKSPLEAASNMVMRIARNSIRNKSRRARYSLAHRLARRPSQPGKPPFSWQPGVLPPFKMIFADWIGIPYTARIVGMVGFGGQPPVPGLHEHGGWARRKVIITTPRRTKLGKFTSPQYTFVEKMVRYPKRPFMYPALVKGKSRYPHLWEGSLTRSSRMAA